MIRRLHRTAAATLAALFLCAMPAASHDYAEFEPLSDEARDMLVTLLEMGAKADRLDGAPEAIRMADQTLSSRLLAVIESADAADMDWLETVDFAPLDHPAYGRIPAGLVLLRLTDLAGEVAHSGSHDHDSQATSERFTLDLRRLKALSDREWGR